MKNYLAIYQIKDIENTEYAFRPYNENLFNFADYKKVYYIDFPECFEPTSDIEVCDHYWTSINVNRAFAKVPTYQYEGHSPSMSDVFCVSGNYYYCDMCGWKNVTDKCTNKGGY